MQPYGDTLAAVTDRVCLVTGVGPGTGSAVVRRFAADGYRVAMLAAGEGASVVTGNTSAERGKPAFADRPDEFFIRPASIADAMHHLVHQDRSAWTFELDLRPFGETW